MRVLKTFLKNSSGATAIEYGLIAAGIAIVIVVSVGALGDKLDSTFQAINSELPAATDGGTSDGGATDPAAGG